MPGTNFKNIGVKMRPIKSELKSKRKVLVSDRPLYAPFLRALRNPYPKMMLKDIDPYVEIYQFRENMWALYEESMDGAGDLWMFIINGPEKIAVIDTGFGVGNLRGVVEHLCGKKPIICLLTHNHYDHAYGAAQFDEIYCSNAEMHLMMTKNNEHVWDYLFDENGVPIWADFDKNDIIEFKPWTPIGIENGHTFDLGQGYEIEAVYITGHTPGNCAYYDKHNHDLFTGDWNSAGRLDKNAPYWENSTVQAKWECLKKFESRIDEVNGVFPGHGSIDLPGVCIKHLIEACQAVLDDPEHAYSKKMIRKTPDGKEKINYSRFIEDGSKVGYNLENVYYDRDKYFREKEEK